MVTNYLNQFYSCKSHVIIWIIWCNRKTRFKYVLLGSHSKIWRFLTQFWPFNKLKDAWIIVIALKIIFGISLMCVCLEWSSRLKKMLGLLQSQICDIQHELSWLDVPGCLVFPWGQTSMQAVECDVANQKAGWQRHRGESKIQKTNQQPWSTRKSGGVIFLFCFSSVKMKISQHF